MPILSNLFLCQHIMRQCFANKLGHCIGNICFRMLQTLKLNCKIGKQIKNRLVGFTPDQQQTVNK